MTRLYPEIVIPGTDEAVVKVLVPAAEWRASMLPTIQAPLSSCEWITRDGVDRYEDFVLLTYEHVRTEQGAFQQLTFGKDYTAINPETGLPFWVKPVLTSAGGTVPHPWAAQLNYLEFYPDENFTVTVPYFNSKTEQQGTIAVPRINVRYELFPAGVFETPVTTRTFVSNVPFRPRRSPHPQPMAKRVQWDFRPIAEGDLGECLHDDIPVPEQLRSYQLLLSDGTSGGVINSGSIGAQNFRRTNFPRRAPYKVNSVPVLNNGMWVMEQNEYFPPSWPHTRTLRLRQPLISTPTPMAFTPRDIIVKLEVFPWQLLVKNSNGTVAQVPVVNFTRGGTYRNTLPGGALQINAAVPTSQILVPPASLTSPVTIGSDSVAILDDVVADAAGVSGHGPRPLASTRNRLYFGTVDAPTPSASPFFCWEDECSGTSDIDLTGELNDDAP